MNFISQKSQSGIALITALLMVFIISILGVAVSQQVISLRKVSTVNYDNTIGLNNAESALAEADNFFSVNAEQPEQLKLSAVNLKSDLNWWHLDSHWIGAATVSSVTEGNPQYLIEDIESGAGGQMGTDEVQPHYYRVTAKGQGKGEAVAYLQSHYLVLE